MPSGADLELSAYRPYGSIEHLFDRGKAYRAATAFVRLVDGVGHVVTGVQLLDLVPKRRGQEKSRALVIRLENSDPAVGDPEGAFVDRLSLVCRDHAVSHPGSLR
jgi:hypothetical protein